MTRPIRGVSRAGAALRITPARLPDIAVAALVATLVTLAAAPAIAHDPPRTRVTWNGDIARLVSARCVRCHAPEGKGPMSLETYADARPWAKAIREEVLARRMPKWHAARGYGEFVNDPSLSPFEISLFVSWVDGGALRGPEPVKLGSIQHTSRMPSAERARQVRLGCGNQRLPAGRLLGITPVLAEQASAGFIAALPGGRHEILGWIRNYEADFSETYWLRTPLDLPAGSRLVVEPTGSCSVTVHLAK